MTLEKWGRGSGGMSGSSAWPVHDQVALVQLTSLTLLMNPSRLDAIRDNEFRTPSDQDAFTLPELFAALDGRSSPSSTRRSMATPSSPTGSRW